LTSQEQLPPSHTVNLSELQGSNFNNAAQIAYANNLLKENGGKYDPCDAVAIIGLINIILANSGGKLSSCMGAYDFHLNAKNGLIAHDFTKSQTGAINAYTTDAPLLFHSTSLLQKDQADLPDTFVFTTAPGPNTGVTMIRPLSHGWNIAGSSSHENYGCHFNARAMKQILPSLNSSGTIELVPFVAQERTIRSDFDGFHLIPQALQQLTVPARI
jgi:hypothetical protein